MQAAQVDPRLQVFNPLNQRYERVKQDISLPTGETLAGLLPPGVRYRTRSLEDLAGESQSDNSTGKTGAWGDYGFTTSTISNIQSVKKGVK